MRSHLAKSAGLVIVAVLVTAAAAGPLEEAPTTDASGIRRILDTAAPGSPTHHPIIAEATRAFYDERNDQHAWLDGEQPSAAARALIGRVSRAQRDGLAPLRALAEVVDSLMQGGQLDRVDVFLTEVFLTYGLLLARGQVAPEAVHADWHAESPPPPDLLGALRAAVTDGDVDAALDGLAPAAPSYRGLREALGRHLELQAAGGWGVVPAGRVLKPGDAGNRVKALRERLAKSGDLEPPAAEPSATPEVGGDDPAAQYDEALAAAVRRFQARHGLVEDGMVGPATLAAVNVPLSTRVRQIALNMERHRWLPPLASRRVTVNVAAQRLVVVDADREVMRMRVVTGQAYTPTPVLTDRISHIVVNPYWHVPRSIAAREILPEIKQDPEGLLRRGFRVFTSHEDEAEEVPAWMVEWASVDPDAFPHVLRQEPGDDNPLGRLKFMFPNRHAIYLHDTPAAELFDGRDRARSQGCVRVERPLALAAFALRDDPRWNGEALERVVTTGERRRIDLPRPLPVYLLYWTAWVEPDGGVSFRDDLYGFDEQLTLALMGLAS